MGEKKTCIEMMGSDWAYQRYRCPNRANHGEYCGVHSPEKQKERAAKRGPTLAEMDRDHRKEERDRVKALESSHADLLGVLTKIRDAFNSDLTNDQACSRVYFLANHAINMRAEEVK